MHESTSTWSHGRTGLWLVGARGSVATTAVVGLAAISMRLAPPTGCVTAGDDLADVPLPAFADIVVGGHDVTDTPLTKRAEHLVGAGMLPATLLDGVLPRLAATEADLRPGYSPPRPGDDDPEPQGAAARRLAQDIVEFRERHDLARVVVVDVSSTEPLVEHLPEHDDLDLLRAALDDPSRAVLPASSVAAYAAVLAGAAYACFTPSTGMGLPALERAAVEAGVPVAGQDGKTGQTWLRTVLAPAFASRGLRVLSWSGTNLLGGGDGATLADPAAVQSKLVSKNRGLQDLTGTTVTPLHIDNVPDLGDVKVAWDHVHVEGFLGSRATLQTTWSAYDSMLAAPIVLDLARLLALAHAAGLRGPVGELGFFFKDPWGSDVHAFAEQGRALVGWAAGAARAVRS